MSRRGRRIAAVAVVVAGVAGCSKSTAPASHTSAAAIQLQSGDLPAAWTGQGSRQPPNSATLTALYGCLGQPVPDVASQGASQAFKSPDGVVVFSVTRIFRSGALAASDLALQQTKAYAACAPNLVTQLFAVLPPGTAFGSVTVAPRSFASQRDGSVAYRFTLPVSHGDSASTATGDTVTVRHGAAQITLLFVGSSDPAAAVSEPAVVTKVVARS